MLEQGGACWGTKFSADMSSVNRYITQDVCSCRSRHGQNTVSAFDLSTAYMNRRNHYLVRCDLIHQHTDCRNIRNSIHRPNFMEMYFCDRLAMRLAFSLGYQHVDGHNIILHLLRKIQMTSDDMLNLMKPTMMVMLMGIAVFMVVVVMFMLMGIAVFKVVVVVMFMLMVMVFILMVMTVLMLVVVMNIHAFFFLTVNSHRNVRSGNTAFHRCLFFHMNTRNAKSVKFFDKSFLIGD